MKNIIALFGMAGTGKTTVTEFFKEKKWQIINQDLLGHEVLDEYQDEIVKIFGEDIITDHKINRNILGKKVFSNTELLRQLMDFSYPIIIKKTNEILLKNNIDVIIEGAVFYKVRTEIPYDYLMYIHVDIDILRTRLKNRGHSNEWIDNIVYMQKDILMAKKYANIIIINNSSKEKLFDQLNIFSKNLF